MLSACLSLLAVLAVDWAMVAASLREAVYAAARIALLGSVVAITFWLRGLGYIRAFWRESRAGAGGG